MATEYVTRKIEAAKARFVGQRFGRLLITNYLPGKSAKGARVICLCDCGQVKEIKLASLKYGLTRSCGCYNRDSKTTHGQGKPGEQSAEYNIWAGMIQRCHNTESKDYPRYGGRGIIVCDEWRYSFEEFFADMGERPTSKHTVDRFPDLAGPYSPDNCRWATPHTQARNRTTNLWVVYRGRRLILSDWADEFQVHKETLWRWYRAGKWPPPDPFGLP